jgi:hypothetical protein|tara:strand:+ start:237 stop:395 length:159 start_codon:yes stop_codon:yes gene_type:complete
MTEQEVVNKFYPRDNTKTISDIVIKFNKLFSTESESIKVIKQLFSDVSDWSI